MTEVYRNPAAEVFGGVKYWDVELTRTKDAVIRVEWIVGVQFWENCCY